VCVERHTGLGKAGDGKPGDAPWPLKLGGHHAQRLHRRLPEFLRVIMRPPWPWIVCRRAAARLRDNLALSVKDNGLDIGRANVKTEQEESVRLFVAFYGDCLTVLLQSSKQRQQAIETHAAQNANDGRCSNDNGMIANFDNPAACLYDSRQVADVRTCTG
jgi:hypothetical protein